MEDSSSLKSQVECDKYLLKLHSCLENLVNSRDIVICQSWIEKLTSCEEDEIILRNKYIRRLCCQVSNGFLENPFLDFPPEGKLSPCPDIVEPEECNNFADDQKISSTQLTHFENKILDEKISRSVIKNNIAQLNLDFLCDKTFSKDDTVILRSPCASLLAFEISESPIVNNSYTSLSCIKENHHDPIDDINKNYEYRANNLVTKLREMKRQNNLLSKKLLNITTETSPVQVCQSEEFREYLEDDVRGISTFSKNDNNLLDYFNKRITEIENFKHFFQDLLANCEEKLRMIENNANYKIDEIISKREIELDKIKISIQTELRTSFEKDIKKLKDTYDNEIKEIEFNNLQRQQRTITEKEKIIKEKDELLCTKDLTISKLEAIVEEQRINLKTVINRLCNKTDSESNTDSLANKIYQLERELLKSERSRKKYIKTSESRIARLEREKQYLIYKFQLQLIRQKAHQACNILNETDSKVSDVLNKLESKYKEVVANIQATAIKRRMQDQLTLESILLATCGNRKNNDDSLHVHTTLDFNPLEHSAYLVPQPHENSRSQRYDEFSQQNKRKSLSDESENSKVYVSCER